MGQGQCHPMSPLQIICSVSCMPAQLLSWALCCHRDSHQAYGESESENRCGRCVLIHVHRCSEPLQLKAKEVLS